VGHTFVPPIHPPTKYQPKIFICFEDTERKGIIMQFCIKVTGSRSKVASTQIFRDTRFSLIHPYTKYQPKIFIRLGDTEQNGISVSRSHSQGQRSHRHNSFFRVTHLCPLMLNHLTIYSSSDIPWALATSSSSLGDWARNSFCNNRKIPGASADVCIKIRKDYCIFFPPTYEEVFAYSLATS
jgi:hypothetical protein